MIALILALLATGSSIVSEEEGYRPSLLQTRVDRSFSNIAIETPLKKVRGRLREERADGCHEAGECDWLDRNKVRHYFWGDGPENLWVVIKSIRTADFPNRSIPALGIGMARSKNRALAAARTFAPELKFDCASGTKTGRQNVRSYCMATLKPGWVTLEFDANDRLTEVRFDGYHFT